jgi:hypothetical protein
MTEEGEKPDKPAPKKGKKASAERAKKGDGDAATPTPKRQKTAKAKEPKAQAAKEQGKLWMRNILDAASIAETLSAPTPRILPALHVLLQRRRRSRCSTRASA